MHGKKCWHVSVGGVTLPSFSLAIGEQTARRQPLRNRSQAKEFRDYFPEVGLYVWCSWRLAIKGVVTATSRSSGPVVIGQLRRLRGRTVKSVVTNPSNDLVIVFDSATTLSLFCDVPRESRLLSQWELVVDDRVLAIEPKRGERLLSRTPVVGE